MEKSESNKKKHVHKIKKHIKITSKFDENKKREKKGINKILSEFLLKAGLDTTPRQLNKKVFFSSLIVCAILSFIVIIAGIIQGAFFSSILYLVLIICTLILVGIYLISLLGVFFYLDYQIHFRTKQIEEVLPEFLQLTSANISAGMPIDRALWFAVRPKFGVLAKEIEVVAKSTIAGDDLEKALLDFANKYKSQSLKETVNLLIEGMRSGGEIGFLLNQISSNMQELNLMRKEISASVSTYVLFITVAAVAGAPFLLALSGQLLGVISSLVSNLDISSAGSSGMFSLDLSGDAISISDFRTFSVIMIFFSSFFSSLIIGVIRKGSPREGLKYFPVFFFVSLIIFFVASMLFSMLLSGIF